LADHSIQEFTNLESGAVAVDWVVLAAAIAGLGVGTIAMIGVGAVQSGGSVSGNVAEFGISTSFSSSVNSGSTDVTQGASETWTPLALNAKAIRNTEAATATLSDAKLLKRLANLEEFSDATSKDDKTSRRKHDRYYIARDEARKRGLI